MLLIDRFVVININPIKNRHKNSSPYDEQISIIVSVSHKGSISKKQLYFY